MNPTTIPYGPVTPGRSDRGSVLPTRHREQEGMTRPGPRMRIRAGHSYHNYFTVSLGQRNATFVERAMTPLARWFSWAHAVTFVPEPGFEAIHTWNAVPLLTRRPYIITFEDYLPRTPDDIRIGWFERALRDRLLSKQCVALIAISEYALRQFRHQHRDFEGLPELLAKTELLYPVVQPRRTCPKPQSDRLKLLFVGRDFMRKGGPSVLRAHARLREHGIPVETTIVSSLDWKRSGYVGRPDGAIRASRTARFGAGRPDLRRSLPLDAVLRLMDRADYLVFPTFHDTFGFVSLEAFAGGTPVITTNACVLPELVTPGVSGHLLPFENDGVVGKWAWLYGTPIRTISMHMVAPPSALATALFEHLATSWENRRGLRGAQRRSSCGRSRRLPSGNRTDPPGSALREIGSAVGDAARPHGNRMARGQDRAADSMPRCTSEGFSRLRAVVSLLRDRHARPTSRGSSGPRRVLPPSGSSSRPRDRHRRRPHARGSCACSKEQGYPAARSPRRLLHGLGPL